jgi:hypothetical protein
MIRDIPHPPRQSTTVAGAVLLPALLLLLQCYRLAADSCCYCWCTFRKRLLLLLIIIHDRSGQWPRAQHAHPALRASPLPPAGIHRRLLVYAACASRGAFDGAIQNTCMLSLRPPALQSNRTACVRCMPHSCTWKVKVTTLTWHVNVRHRPSNLYHSAQCAAGSFIKCVPVCCRTSCSTHVELAAVASAHGDRGDICRQWHVGDVSLTQPSKHIKLPCAD